MLNSRFPILSQKIAGLGPLVNIFGRFVYRILMLQVGLVASILYAQSRVSSQELKRRILASLGTTQESKKKLADVTWPLQNSSPTIGDFLPAIVLARVLVRLGFRVRFRVDTSGGFPRNIGTPGFLGPEELLSTWEDLYWGLGGFSESEPGEHTFVVSEKSRYELGLEEADLEISSQAPMFAVLPMLLGLLWAQPEVHSRAADDFFFKAPNHSNSEIVDPRLEFGYIAWHVRYASNDSQRNLTESEVANTFAMICEGTNLPVLLLSDQAGRNYVARVLQATSQASNADLRLIMQPNDGFLGASAWLINAKAYVAFYGGGITAIALFSRTPYFSVQIDSGSFPKPKNSAIFPWSSSDQIYNLVNKHELPHATGVQRQWKEFLGLGNLHPQ